jgi:hypothetical protein
LFEIDNTTIAVGTSAAFAWNYVGDNEPREYTFSYTCGTEASFLLQKGAGWELIDCDTEYATRDSIITVIPSNDSTRFADVELSIVGNELSDIATITIVNPDILTTDDLITDESNTGTIDTGSVSGNTNTNSASTQGSGTQTVVRRSTKPVYSGPSDLVLEIKETGVILEVNDEDKFFPISPIKSDKVAGVKFTVTNRGGELSDIWTFEATLPIEGDDEYEYTSPKQVPLKSGMEVEFTLGFDEILEEDEGTITITLDPNDKKDKSSNNEDSTTIEIEVVD